ncbi:MAG: restriction endonuclease subunit S [Dokdonella sp.]|jgi:type I restriction enzyme S subunit|uniref:restriction endonuclease subunit S n=1 Tax=Dokdonella sp. TaxID=2291710 RepID=UPI0025BA3BF0|nr:restriction endonuclease subunit S [Dokdonella sp.]MBK8122741.1 restriction endonuclease subunit S [Dokdonella sp.]
MKWVELKDVAEVSAGNPAPQAASDFSSSGKPFVRMQDVGRGHHTRALVETADRVSADAIRNNRLRLFSAGTLLIPKSGASINLNHRALLARDAYVVSHLATVVPDTSRVDPEYLYFWSLTYDPRSQAQTTSLPSLPTSLIKAAQIPVPPLEEQQCIIDLLSRAEGIVRLRREAQRKAAELVPALFLDMFGDPASNPKGWPVVALGELLAACDYGTSKKASTDDAGVPVLRMGNVSYEGDLLLDNVKHVMLDESKFERQALESGDLLFNRTNSKELVGKTGIWDGRWPAVAASYFIRLRVDQARVLPIYAWAVMNSKDMKKRLFATARGAIGQSNINTKELKRLPCSVPPIELQRQFAAKADAVRGIAAQQTAALATAQATFDALLHRSFSPA